MQRKEISMEEKKKNNILEICEIPGRKQTIFFYIVCFHFLNLFKDDIKLTSSLTVILSIEV